MSNSNISRFGLRNKGNVKGIKDISLASIMPNSDRGLNYVNLDASTDNLNDNSLDNYESHESVYTTEKIKISEEYIERIEHKTKIKNSLFASKKQELSHDYFSIAFGNKIKFLDIALTNALKSHHALKSKSKGHEKFSFIVVTESNFLDNIKKNESLNSLYQQCLDSGITFITLDQVGLMAKEAISADVLLKYKDRSNKWIEREVNRISKDIDTNVDYVSLLCDSQMYAFASDTARVLTFTALMNNSENHFIVKLEADALLNGHIKKRIDKAARENDFVGTKYYRNNIPYFPRSGLLGKFLDSKCNKPWDDISVAIVEDKDPSSFFYNSLAYQAIHIRRLSSEKVKLYNSLADADKVLVDKDSPVQYEEVTFLDAFTNPAYTKKFFLGKDYNSAINIKLPKLLTASRSMSNKSYIVSSMRKASQVFNPNVWLVDNSKLKSEYKILADFGVESLIPRNKGTDWDAPIELRTAVPVTEFCAPASVTAEFNTLSNIYNAFNIFGVNLLTSIIFTFTMGTIFIFIRFCRRFRKSPKDKVTKR